jgi:DNA-binding NarL/FixJ family response regulator
MMNMTVQTPSSPFLGGFTLPASEMSSTAPAARTEAEKTTIAILCENRIFRTCFARCLQSMTDDFAVASYDGLADWVAAGQQAFAGILLLCATSEKATEVAIRQTLAEVLQNAVGARVIIVSDAENPALMMEALTSGAKGFVTMNTDLDVAVGAIRLVDVGGTFIPASGLMSARAAQSAPVAPVPAAGRFSERQLEVLELARQGDPNKIIAFKLHMSEATVKVHLRNMMRKLNARNRTELIFKSNELMGNV